MKFEINEKNYSEQDYSLLAVKIAKDLSWKESQILKEAINIYDAQTFSLSSNSDEDLALLSKTANELFLDSSNNVIPSPRYLYALISYQNSTHKTASEIAALDKKWLEEAIIKGGYLC